jgi:hypothetical protein
MGAEKKKDVKGSEYLIAISPDEKMYIIGIRQLKPFYVPKQEQKSEVINLLLKGKTLKGFRAKWVRIRETS